LIAYLIGNISAKNIKIIHVCESYSKPKVGRFLRHGVLTGNIALSATRWYLSYSEADFEVSCTAEATRCTDLGEIWHGGGTKGSQKGELDYSMFYVV